MLLFVLIQACSPQNKEKKEEEHDHGHQENEVSLTKEQREVLGLKTGHAKSKKLAEVVYANGNLELPPNDKADVSSLVGGVIKKVSVIEGTAVQKGQVLAILEHPEIVQMQQDYLSHLNELGYLEKEKSRQEKLYTEKVGSGKNLQKVTSEYRATLANVEGIKAKLKMLGLSPHRIEEGKIYPSITIKSPIKGKVSLVETNIGAFVQPQDKLFEVVNNEDLHVALKVYEKDVSKVKVGQEILFQVSNQGEVMKGEVFAISPAFEESPRAVHIHAHIHAEKLHLISGMYVQGRVVVNETKETQVLPEDAIVTEGDRSFVFVKNNNSPHEHDDGHNHESDQGKVSFVKTEVILGVQEAGYIEVKFLKKIDKEVFFAINSAYYLLAEMTKKETEHVH